MTFKCWFSQNVGFQCWLSQNWNLVRKLSCFPSMSESYYFHPSYQASMIAALSFKDPAICHRSPGENQDHQAVGTFWNARSGLGTVRIVESRRKLGWDVWVAWIALSGPLRDRSILHQGYYIKAEEHLACDHDLNISLYVSGKGTKKCLTLGVGVLGSILDGYVSLACGNLFLILLRHMQFSQYKLSYFLLTR